MYLRSEFGVLMSVTISAKKPCSVRLYLQLYVGGLIPYLLDTKISHTDPTKSLNLEVKYLNNLSVKKPKQIQSD
jgi:hypothetical protein